MPVRTLLATVFVQLLTFILAQHCPTECRCTNSRHAECNGIDYSSAVYKNILILNISHSNVTFSPSYQFHQFYPNLKVLYLDYNHLNYINQDVFQGLKSLTHLSMEGSDVTTLPHDLFMDNDKLEVLNLNKNNNLKIYGSFIFVSSLRSLNMEFCRIELLPQTTFQGLSMLQHLRLSYNTFQKLDNKTFLLLYELNYLYVSHNNIVTVENGSFLPLQNLNFLDLSYNYINNLEDEIFINQGNLEVLDLSNNQIKILPENIFMSLGNVTEMNLENNLLESLHSNLFVGMKSVKKLLIGGNLITNLDSHIFLNLQYLTHLYLSDNNLKTITVCQFPAQSSLQYLRLNGNSITCDCDMWNIWNWCSIHGISLWAPATCEYAHNINSMFQSMNCNESVCYDSDIIHIEPNNILFFVLFIVTPVAVILLFVIITINLCIKCMKFKSSDSHSSTVLYRNSHMYDVVADLSHSTEPETMQRTFPHEHSSLESCTKYELRSDSSRYSGIYNEHIYSNLASPSFNNMSYVPQNSTAALNIPALNIYSTSEDEEEVLLKERKRLTGGRATSLRPAGIRRVLPRPSSLQLPQNPSTHLTDVEPQSSTLSEFSDSNERINEVDGDSLELRRQ